MPSQQLTRQWRLLQVLEASRAGKTVSELVEAVGAPRRTIYRDLDDLQDAGFPVYHEDEAHRWGLIEGWRFKVPPPFTPTELMSLWLYRDLLQAFQGTPFYDSLEEVFRKVQACLSGETLGYLERIKSGFSVGIKPYKDYARVRGILNQVNQAVLDCRRLEIAYKPLRTDKEVTRKVDPYRVWFFEGSLYLIAHCHLRGEVRMFVLDRMKMVRTTAERFPAPEDFDLDEFLRHSFKVMRGDQLHRVRVRISPAWARWAAEKTWHQSQEAEEQEDGGVILSFTVADAGEVKRWVLGFGPEAEVLEPPSLRRELRDDLKRSLVRYQAGADENRAGSGGRPSPLRRRS